MRYTINGIIGIACLICLLAGELEASAPVISGRMDLDAGAFISAPKPANDDILLRRLRLGLRGDARRYGYRADLDFSDGEAEFKYLWAAARSGNRLLRVGQFKMPSGLMNQGSSWYQGFAETPMTEVLAPGFRLGAAISGVHDDWGYAFAIHGQEIEDYRNSAVEPSIDSWTSRLVWSPRRDGGRAIHIGLSIARQAPRPDGFDISSGPETRIDVPYLVEAAFPAGIETLDIAGLEGLWIRESLMIQSEIMRATVGGHVDVPVLYGAYLEASWAMNGDWRDYVFKPSRPGAPGDLISSCGCPIRIDYGLRLSVLDLRDTSAGLDGGQATQLTARLNYHLAQRYKFTIQGGWVWYDAMSPPTTPVSDGDFGLLQARIGYRFQ